MMMTNRTKMCQTKIRAYLKNFARENTVFLQEWSQVIKKIVRIDFLKIPGISTLPDVEFGTGAIPAPLYVIVL
jgi:hypothetical protein